ncbi:transcriptional regulator [Streptomyces sp. NPDC088116]|uniref:transcriptional regulator n=1 Tax=Streptomyces sp. NPDC088116 TaxID=3365825 RepID=UPI0037F6CED7
MSEAAVSEATDYDVAMSEAVEFGAVAPGSAVPGSAVPGSAGVRGPVLRVRVALVRLDSGAPVVDEHLRVDLPAPGRWAQLADVLLGEGEGAESAAQLAACHPGALVVAVHRGPDCWMRFGADGPTLTLRARRAPAPGWGIWASLAHTCLVAGLPAEALGSASVRLRRAQAVASPSSCSTRSRTPWASADSDRPAAE